jgi:capsular polysaccharide biosynthesis protein
MYVLSKQDKNDSVTYSDLQTGSQLTKDYTELIKSRPVLEQVISILNLDMEVDTLKDRISVETPTDTRIISISVEDEDPEMAKQIADTVREAASIQITEIMDLDAVNQIEEGSLPTEPSSPNLKRNTIVGGVAGIVLVVAILVLIYMLDDTIKTAEDVENYLDLNVLASLPLEEGTKNKKRTKKLELRKLMKKMKKA